MGKIITHVNQLSRRYLGGVGRPLLTAAGAGLVFGIGVPRLVTYLVGYEVFAWWHVAIGATVLTLAAVAVTEGFLWLFGNDAETNAQYTLQELGKIKTQLAKDDAYTAAYKKALAKGAGIGERQLELLIAALDRARGVSMADMNAALAASAGVQQPIAAAPAPAPAPVVAAAAPAAPVAAAPATPSVVQQVAALPPAALAAMMADPAVQAAITAAQAALQAATGGAGTSGVPARATG